MVRLPREGEGGGGEEGEEGGPERVKKPRTEFAQLLHDGSEIGRYGWNTFFVAARAN